MMIEGLGTVSEWRWAEDPEAKVIRVIDVGHGHTRSVTNDADAVIGALAREVSDIGEYRVIYLDSERHWDELVIKNGAFAGFAPLQRQLTEEMQDALEFISKPPWNRLAPAYRALGLIPKGATR